MGQIIVRPCECSKIEGSHFEIIDGENRWMAAQDRRIDLAELDCLVENKDDIEARIETINYNQERGEVVREKLDALIKDIESRGKITKEDIAKRLFISPENLMLRVTPLLVKAEPAKVRLEARLPTFTISARMHSREDYDFINSILGSIMESEECDQASALLSVFRAYGIKK